MNFQQSCRNIDRKSDKTDYFQILDPVLIHLSKRSLDRNLEKNQSKEEAHISFEWSVKEASCRTSVSETLDESCFLSPSSRVLALVPNQAS